MSGMKWYGVQAVLKAEAAIKMGLGKSAEDLLRKSRDVAPKEFGTLRASGFTSVEGNRAAVSYDTPYALRLHEGSEGWNWTMSGTGPKYLEKPALEHGNDHARIVAAELRRALK
jgi:hypothetical protein